VWWRCNPPLLYYFGHLFTIIIFNFFVLNFDVHNVMLDLFKLLCLMCYSENVSLRERHTSKKKSQKNTTKILIRNIPFEAKVSEVKQLFRYLIYHFCFHCLKLFGEKCLDYKVESERSRGRLN